MRFNKCLVGYHYPLFFYQRNRPSLCSRDKWYRQLSKTHLAFDTWYQHFMSTWWSKLLHLKPITTMLRDSLELLRFKIPILNVLCLKRGSLDLASLTTNFNAFIFRFLATRGTAICFTTDIHSLPEEPGIQLLSMSPRNVHLHVKPRKCSIYFRTHASNHKQYHLWWTVLAVVVLHAKYLVSLLSRNNPNSCNGFDRIQQEVSHT